MPQFKFDIVANIEQLVAGLNEAKAAVSEATETMKSSFEGVTGVVEKVQTAMLAITAILAGGAAFKEAITESVNLASSAASLGKQLGISATEASALRVALDETLVPQEAVQTAASKITQTLKKNENAFKELGVATRDQNGNFRNSLDIMTDVNSRLLQFKEGTDRNVEGAKIYGRSWGEVAPTLKLTAEAMEEARVKGAELGLIVGQEGVAQARAYKVAMAAVHTVFDALENVIGQAVVPALTKLGEWFASVGPQAVAAFRAAIFSVYAAFTYLKEGVEVTTVWIAGHIDILGAQIMRFANSAERALHLDFAGAKQAWSDGTKDIENKSRAMSDAIQADMANAQKARDSFFESQDAQQTPSTVKDGAASTGGDGKEKSQMAAFEEMLAAKKAGWAEEQAAEGSFREFSKEQDREFWQERLTQVRAGSADELAIKKKIFDDTYAIAKESFDGQLALLKAEEAAHKNNMTARLAIEEEYASRVKQAYGEDSKQYAEAQKAIVETKRAAAEQIAQVEEIQSDQARQRALNEVQIQEDAAKLRYQNGRISMDQLVELERQFETQKLAITQDGLRRKLEILAQDPDKNPVKVAQINAQIEALQRQHTAAMTKITQQEEQQSAQIYKQFTDTLGNGFSTAFQGIINHTMTLGQAVRSVFQSMLSTVISVLAQMAAKQLMQHIMAMAQNKEELTSNAAVAATGAGKSAAQIPYVGWLLAIGAMASVFAAASSYSAAGGFDVPSGVNPMTQLHQKEMVLPAPLAERVRGMTEPGMGGGGGGRAPKVMFPGKDLGNHFLMQKDDLVSAIKQLHRDGHFG